MKYFLILALSGLACLGSETHGGADEAAVRELITKRNAAYRNLDAKTLAPLLTSDFRLVDRLGDNYRSRGPEFNERMWAWGFKHVYRGRPGPQHRIVQLELLSPTVAMVQTSAIGRRSS